jgi:hypothetical protein
VQIGALPFFQTVVFVLLAVFPLVWLPWQLVWVYGQLLWLLEPVLLVAEVVLAQNVVMRIGQNLAEKIEDDDQHATLSKVIFIFLFILFFYFFILQLYSHRLY